MADRQGAKVHSLLYVTATWAYSLSRLYPYQIKDISFSLTRIEALNKHK